MGYAIMRLEKIKSKSSFAAIQRHTLERDRLRHRKNPSREDENRWFQNKHYERDMGLIARFEKLTEGLSIRKNAVLGFEIIMAYSPEDEPFINHDAWKKKNLEWISKEFGGAVNVIGAFYHADETTPHMHAVVIPCVEKNGVRKLSAYHYVHGKESLVALQTRYAEAMQEFGLKRGITSHDDDHDNHGGPGVHHKTLREYWAAHDAKELTERSEASQFISKIFDEERK